MSPPDAEVSYYTRAGNFRFDENGYLVDPHGYRLQGWQVQQSNASMAAQGGSAALATTGVQIKGVPQDIKLDNFQSPPQATSRVDMILNVDSRAVDKATADGAPPAAAAYDGQPFTAMFDAYDANAVSGTPLGDAKYSYQSTIKVYDENGSAHNLTVYMDPINDPDVTNSAGGKRYWEYIITVPPNEDNREFWGVQADTRTRGILMAGTLTFNAAGELENMSAFTINNPYNGTSGVPPVPGASGPPVVPPVAGAFASDAARIDNWTPANFSQNGYPICTANFLGAENGSITATDNDILTANIPPLDETLNIDNTPKNIEINFGLRNKSAAWTGVPTYNLENLKAVMTPTVGTPSGTITTPVQMRTALDAIPGMSNLETSALATTNYSSASTTVYQAQDGYTAGFLQNISVSRDGVVTGKYSNGQVLELYAVTLATFNNNYALYREGGIYSLRHVLPDRLLQVLPIQVVREALLPTHLSNLTLTWPRNL